MGCLLRNREGKKRRELKFNAAGWSVDKRTRTFFRFFNIFIFFLIYNPRRALSLVGAFWFWKYNICKWYW